MVERDEASPKLGIPNPSRSGIRILEAEPAASNIENQGKCLGTKLGALQQGEAGVYTVTHNTTVLLVDRLGI